MPARSRLVGSAKQLADLCRIEPEASLWTLAQAHDTKVVGVPVNEVPTDPETACDLGGIDQFDGCGAGAQQVSHSCRHCLDVRFAEGHRYLHPIRAPIAPYTSATTVGAA
jgi:hypothetical protein